MCHITQTTLSIGSSPGCLMLANIYDSAGSSTPSLLLLSHSHLPQHSAQTFAYTPSSSVTLSGLPSGYITGCRVLTAHNSPNYQPPSPLSGPSLKAACHPPSPPGIPTLTTRRMLCLKPAVPESLLDLIWQVHSLTARSLLSQEDAPAGTLRPLWAETFLPVYPGSIAPGDHTLAPV